MRLALRMITLVFGTLLLSGQRRAEGFVPVRAGGGCLLSSQGVLPLKLSNRSALNGKKSDTEEPDDSWNLNDNEIETLFEGYDDYLDGKADFTPLKQLDQAELAWRYVRKPLLSIGGKGAALSHGNSLRQLLNDHTAVKVKVNLKTFGKKFGPKHYMCGEFYFRSLWSIERSIFFYVHS